MAEYKNQFKLNNEKEEPKVKKKSKAKVVPKKLNFAAYFKDEKFKKILGLFLIILSVYLFVTFVSYLFSWKADDNIFDKTFWGVLFDKSIVVENWSGRLGAFTGHLFIKKWFGMASFLFVLLSFISGVRLFLEISILPLFKTFKHVFFLLILISVTFAYVFISENTRILGGIFGYQANVWLQGIFGTIGTGFIIFFAILSYLILNALFPYDWVKNLFVFRKKDEDETLTEDGLNAENDLQDEELENVEDTISLKNTKEINNLEVIDLNKEPDPEIELIVEQQFSVNSITDENDNHELTLELTNSEDFKNESSNLETNNEEIEPELVLDDSESNVLIDAEPYDPKKDLSSYISPSYELLDDYGSGDIKVKKEELEANKNKIVETLNNYQIKIDKIKATIGPTVTLYEIVPAPGVRISKIKNLEDDIALSLAALGIRIIAPIPGKGTIGIEVPNSNPEVVSMKSLLNCEKFQNTKHQIPIALGKTISNEEFIADLTKMPHLLVAGATGQGKSVGLNAIIASILHKMHPSEVKFVLVDPKKVELNLFSKIERHFLAKLPDVEDPIITDTKKVVKTLNSLCVEMDNRYELLKDAQVRNIKEYNIKFKSRRLNPEKGHKFMPYIVIIIDEFADLIMTAGKEVELPIARLAQLARAIGIHLVIATQRPSVNIITGTIKANFPARIAFRVTSKIDSRTILDTGGAEQLIGRGDMLLSTGTELVRLQCGFIDTHEVEKITEFISSQRGYIDAFLLPEVGDEEGGGNGTLDSAERDELFEEAARIIVTHQQGSTSLIQRKLKLGYNRAGRIIDQLEAAGIVGPFEGSKAREVKIKDLISLEQFLGNI